MREACVACKNKPGSCKRRNATYVVECGECKLEGIKSKYHGETHRTLWDRFSEHENAIKKLDKSNALAAHWLEWHLEAPNPPNFIYSVSKICKTSLERQIWEGVEIKFSDTERVLNQKGEWGCNLPPSQTTVVRGEIYQELDQSRKRKVVRPPEPPDPPDGEEPGAFESQYKQRKKKRKIEFKARLGDETTPSLNS